MEKDILYLASGSKSRQKLLRQVDIKFEVIEHNSDETKINLKDNFENYVLDIAKYKMQNIVLPKFNSYINKEIFILTADTLCIIPEIKKILGKPGNIAKLKEMHEFINNRKAEVVTACCLFKKKIENNSWHNISEICWTTKSIIEICIRNTDFEEYINFLPESIDSAGGFIIEGFGQRYLKAINGSYTNIIGLPIFELIQKLKELSFKF